MLRATTDHREARFLAAQAERLAGGKKQHGGCHEAAREGGPSAVDGKERTRRFFADFRRACSGFHGQLDSLLLLPSSSAAAGGDDDAPSDDVVTKRGDAKAYYATAARRNEGRAKLDAILQGARSLQRHALASSSSVLPAGIPFHGENNDEHEEEDATMLILRSILENPMPDVTQTDLRLISQEVDKVLKRVDGAREIVCPKERFVFKRYRKAMQDLERSGEGADGTIQSSLPGSADSKGNGADSHEDDGDAARQDNMRSRYGGVLENMSNCTVEISSNGSVSIDEGATMERLPYYSGPRPAHALHPAVDPGGTGKPTNEGSEESSSYLLQDLRDVTVLIHGSRPSIHLQRIRNCRVYASEPTLGAVHVTDCRASEVRCSCYQLRVHDSRDVEFGVWVRSGPIIEDSTGMMFRGDYYAGDAVVEGSSECAGDGGVVGRNMYWDVKDFNWLRALRKSPNFVVIKETAAAVGAEGGSESNHHTQPTDVTSMTSFVAPVVPNEVNEDDSEDEL